MWAHCAQALLSLRKNWQEESRLLNLRRLRSSRLFIFSNCPGKSERACRPGSPVKKLTRIEDWNLSRTELDPGNATGAFLQTPAPLASLLQPNLWWNSLPERNHFLGTWQEMKPMDAEHVTINSPSSAHWSSFLPFITPSGLREVEEEEDASPEEQSRKGLRHNLDLSRKKSGKHPGLETPGLASLNLFGKLVHVFGELVHIFAWKLVSRTSKQVSRNLGPLWQPGLYNDTNIVIFFSLAQAPLPDPTPTPSNTPKRTRNGPEKEPNGAKRTRTEPNGAEMDRNQAPSGGTAGGCRDGGGWGVVREKENHYTST